MLKVADEAAPDGLDVIRTSLPKVTLSDEGAVRACRPLAKVERAFRALKTVDLQIRPLYHRLAPRVTNSSGDADLGAELVTAGHLAAMETGCCRGVQAVGRGDNSFCLMFLIQDDDPK
jgi:hypothetical protein